jgi:signal transduction histidine kinase
MVTSLYSAMRARRRTALAAIAFTALVLAAVNVGWWLYYRSITTYLEQQLSQRLTSLAAMAALHVSPDKVEQLLIENLDAYAEQLDYLDSIAAIDSLSEASIIDLDFNYLVSTRTDLADEGYLLAKLNFDSLTQAAAGRPAASRLYNIDGTYLKSAYAPLFDTSGAVAAVFVAEAGAGYFDLLTTLRRNLLFLAGGSAGAVVLLLTLYIIYNRRLAWAEQKLFQSSSEAALGRMVAVVSHEIKNPMMIIHAAGERIAKKYQDPEASFIVEEIARLDHVVGRYLSFARGDQPLTLDRVDMAVLCAKVIGEFQAQFDEQQVRLECHLDETLPPITADRVGLRQVFVNLLLNALQAVTGDDRKSEGRLVEVELTVSARAEMIILRVSDNGPGIKPSHRGRLFEPFYTTKTHGSGLGLYLSKRIVEQHRGKIAATDVKKEMTTFEVTLPLGAKL